MPGEIVVRMAQIAVGGAGESLAAIGLGSCVAACVYDPATRVGGLVHVVLPDSSMARPDDLPGKFADTAIEALVDHVIAAGGGRYRLRAAIAGGAHVFNFGGVQGTRLDIGRRNASAVSEHLKCLRIPLVGEDCGGGAGRTVKFTLEDGLVTVRTVGQQTRELASLGRILHSGRARAA